MPQTIPQPIHGVVKLIGLKGKEIKRRKYYSAKERRNIINLWKYLFRRGRKKLTVHIEPCYYDINNIRKDGTNIGAPRSRVNQSDPTDFAIFK